MEDYQWEAVDKWMLKLICAIITDRKNIADFSKEFFNDNK